jgi:hypothetical protein
VSTGAGTGSGSTRFRRGSEGSPEVVWEALVQSQVRFNRVPEKVPEDVLGEICFLCIVS